MQRYMYTEIQHIGIHTQVAWERGTEKNRERRNFISIFFTLHLIPTIGKKALENKSWKNTKYVNYDYFGEMEMWVIFAICTF